MTQTLKRSFSVLRLEKESTPSLKESIRSVDSKSSKKEMSSSLWSAIARNSEKIRRLAVNADNEKTVDGVQTEKAGSIKRRDSTLMKNLSKVDSGASEVKPKRHDSLISVEIDDKQPSEEHKKKLEEAEKRAKELSDKLNESESRCKILEERVGDVEKSLEDAEKNFQDAEKNRQDIEKNLQDAEKSLQDAEKNLQDTQAQHKQTMEEVEDKHKDLTDKHNDLSDKHKDLSDKHEELTDKHEKSEAHRKALESHVADLKKDLQDAKDQQASAEAARQSAKDLMDNVMDKLHKSEVNYKILEKRVIETEKNLQDAHDFIFANQPRRPVITPAEAAAEFRELCATVEDWVQTKLGDALDERRLMNRKYINSKDAEKFLALIPLAGRENLKTPDTDEHHVLAAIMNFLGRELFDKNMWCPVGPGVMEFLELMAKNMENLEAKRDLAAIRSWRSEALIALASGAEFTSQSKAHMNTLTTNLTNMVKIFLPDVDNQDIYRSVKDSIIVPAATLAQKFQLSIDVYSIQWSQLHRERAEDRDLSQYECLNVLPPKRALKFPAAAQDYEIQYLFDICPGLLHREIKENAYGEPNVLKASKILVAAKSAVRLDSEVPATVSLEQFPTLLAWLDEVGLKKQSCLRTYLEWLGIEL